MTPVFDGRTAAARRVDSRQGGRLLTTSSVSFAVDLPGPEHGRWDRVPGDPDTLPQTGPAGPAPSMPLDELDIRIADDITSGEFVRRFWWRATVPIPDDPLVHTLVAVYVTDVYMIDPALQVHGHSMKARTHRSGTTDSSIWFHQPVRANEWNLLETRSPAAARGRGVVTGSLVRADGVIAATLVQEGLSQSGNRSRGSRTLARSRIHVRVAFINSGEQHADDDGRDDAEQRMGVEQRIHLIVRQIGVQRCFRHRARDDRATRPGSGSRAARSAAANPASTSTSRWVLSK